MACNLSAESKPSENLVLASAEELDDWETQSVITSSEGSLSALRTLERDFSFIHHYYVDSDQLVDDRLQEMLEMALQMVESNVDEVQFLVQENQIIGTVGTHTRNFSVRDLTNLGDLLLIIKPIAVFLDDALPDEVDRSTVEYLLLNGVLSALDPHSILLPPVEAAEMEVDNQGEFGGLGIEISLQEGQLTVKQPIEGTPAWEAGLKSEDRIVRIENTSTINMDLDEAVSLLRGKVGEPVTILVLRTGWDIPRAFTIIRGRIKIDPVKGELLGSIGYVKIQSFHQNVASDMEDLLKELRKKSGKLDGLIIDLRNNPGGYLNQAIKVSDKFIRHGVLVSTVEGASREREETHARSSNTISDIPIAVLVNGNSASASEIVAGALRNQSRAIIIGERTFGKGSVQHLYGNPDESRLKLTVAQYLTPGDQSIQSVGIPPDVLLKPSLIRSETDDADEMVSLYWREWLTREGDLDRHLANESLMEGQTRFSLRYLYEELEGKDRTDPKKDWEVEFAKAVLLATEGVDRSSALIAAQTVVERMQSIETTKIREAFVSQEIDWSEGVNHYEQAKEDLKLDIQFSKDDLLTAGQEESIVVKMSNTSTKDYYQLSLLMLSDNPSLDHREMYFGKISAGESIKRTVQVTLPRGYGSEKQEVQLMLRDQDKTLFEETTLVTTEFQPLPRFKWEVTAFDGINGLGVGNGNGIPELGEKVAVQVVLENIGGGAAVEPYVRLKNRSRKLLDLIEGTIEFGSTLEDCDEADCYKVLKSGAKATGVLLFEVKELPENGAWDLELFVGSNRTYDYSTSVMGGFSDYFQLKTPLSFSVDSKWESVMLDQPHIVVEKKQVNDDLLEISGYIEDDSGITDILVFKGDDKIYYKGETGLKGRIPFTVDVELEDGSNPIYILTKDNQGLNSSKYLQVWK